MIGASLNQYRITASIGAGGMGEVFRALDTRLNRDVAIKVLPKNLVAEADRLRRFEQEAKTLAALNHPNILTIHDAGVYEGAPYLVSELLEGKTLREELEGYSGGVSAPNAMVADRRNPLPVRKATEYALQIAHGLAAAHGKGVIHRDLKPENIFVTKDGRVKILDFGLAKLRVGTTGRSSLESKDAQQRVPTSGDADASTVVQPAAESTEPGQVMGTPTYMAPEQVRGEPADHRSDIFAFGAVLYEMLSGTRVFRRDTPVESMNAILTDEPTELVEANPNVPPALDRMVARCFSKSPDNRFLFALSWKDLGRLMVFEPGKELRLFQESRADSGAPFARLGSNLVLFTVRDGSRFVLASASLEGRGVKTIEEVSWALGGGALAVAGAPDGKTIYYALDGFVYSIPASGGAPKKLIAGNSVAVDPHGQYLVVKVDSETGSYLLRYGFSDGSEQRIPTSGRYPIGGSSLGPSAISRDGRIALQVSPFDSWFWPAAILDPRTGEMELAAQIEADMANPGWDDEGRLITSALFFRSSLWRFHLDK